MDEEGGANPCDGLAPSFFVTPMDELRHLKHLMKSGKLVAPSASPTFAVAEKRSRSDSATNSSSAIPSLDNSVSLNVSRSNVSISNNNVVDSQKMNQRLKEVFREKIAEYREAVYLLFGYKVNIGRISISLLESARI